MSRFMASICNYEFLWNILTMWKYAIPCNMKQIDILFVFHLICFDLVNSTTADLSSHLFCSLASHDSSPSITNLSAHESNTSIVRSTIHNLPMQLKNVAGLAATRSTEVHSLRNRSLYKSTIAIDKMWRGWEGGYSNVRRARKKSYTSTSTGKE